MRRITQVLVTMTLFGFVGVSGATAAQLTGEQIRREIVGNTLKGQVGLMTIRVIHREDGTSSLSSMMRSADGRWSIEGNQICVDWKGGMKPPARCQSLERTGDGKYRSSMRGITLTVE